MPRTTKTTETPTTPPAAIAAAEKLMAPAETVADPAGKPAADVLREVIETQSDPDVRRVARREELLVNLSRDELLAKGDEFAKLHADLARHEVHAKMIRDRLKSDESSITSAIATIADQIRAKQELRMVDVEVVLDFKTNRYAEIRKDNGEEIPGRTRALSEQERKAFLDDRQGKLPLAEARQSDFTDPLKAASDSELVGAPVNSGKVGCSEEGCIVTTPHTTHMDSDDNTWSTPAELASLRNENDDG